jgi:hypothetical protein
MRHALFRLLLRASNPSSISTTGLGLARGRVAGQVKGWRGSALHPGVLALLSAAAIPSGCHIGAATEADAESQWKAMIKAQHWTPEIPPSTYTRPGLVFAVLTDSDGNSYRRTLCPDITDGAKPKVDTEVPTVLTGTVDIGASVGVSVTEKILGTGNAAGIAAAISDATNVSFKPQDVRRVEMPSPKSGERAIPAACIPELKSTLYRAADGTYTVPVFVVVQALRYGSLSASYDGQSGPQLSAKLAAASAATVNADVHAKRTGKATLEFTPADGKSIYVGTHLQQVKRLEVLRQIAAKPVADVTFAKPQFSDVADLGTLPLK